MRRCIIALSKERRYHYKGKQGSLTNKQILWQKQSILWPLRIDHNKGEQYRCHSRKINQKQEHSTYTLSHFVISGRLGEAGRSEFAMKLKKKSERNLVKVPFTRNWQYQVFILWRVSVFIKITELEVGGDKYFRIG